jgi:hypothetical protein
MMGYFFASQAYAFCIFRDLRHIAAPHLRAHTDDTALLPPIFPIRDVLADS